MSATSSDFGTNSWAGGSGRAEWETWTRGKQMDDSHKRKQMSPRHYASCVQPTLQRSLGNKRNCPSNCFVGA